MKKIETSPIFKAKLLGDFVLSPYRFEMLDQLLKGFKTPEYKRLNHKEKSDRVNRALVGCIQNAPFESFLLIAVVEYIDRIVRENILINYTLSAFEIWLNQLSGLSEEENYLIRARIVGKWIPRDAYQILFPIGMGKVHPGSHFVTGHASADLDTTVASFWGWVDAFGARVGEGVHVWNIPGGGPQSSIEVALLFRQIFGQNAFEYISRGRTSLALSSLELMTQRGVISQKADRSSLMVDHERSQKAVIIVDDEGYFLGDWRSFDVDGVRQVMVMLNNALRWFENHLHFHLIALFAKKNLVRTDFPQFVENLFGLKIQATQVTTEHTEKQIRYMEGYLRKVLHVEKGLEATFVEFAQALKGLGLSDFWACMEKVGELESSTLFGSDGQIIEERPSIFQHLQTIISLLDKAIQSVWLYTERLEVALSIKQNVFGYLPQVISYRADVAEIKTKMGSYPYLTVTSADEVGRMIPLGVVRARDLLQPILGTVTLRDFCNREETKIPSYLEVISVIDHHKSELYTTAPCVAYLSDAQSANVVVAELSFAINDQYGTLGIDPVALQEQIEKGQKDLKSNGNKRILRRLLGRQQVVDSNRGYFIHPLREFVEYLHFLYAILDDTDLLTKVSRRDVECVASLLNRLKSLMCQEEVEIIQFDDLKEDATFVEKAAGRILQHPDMYSLYKKIYIAKEQLVEENLQLCAEGKESSIFADTKLQSGCVRVGQAKMFANNFPSFKKHRTWLLEAWVKEAQEFFTDHREFDLHLQMVSTLAGAEDLYSGQRGNYVHKDELWIWIPMTDQSIEHLMVFLSGLRTSLQMVTYAAEVEVELIGPASKELSKIFQTNFSGIRCQVAETEGRGFSIGIIRFPAGVMNSRKAMISPYLPKLIA